MGKNSLDRIAGQAVVESTPPEGTSNNPLYEAESVRSWAATVVMPEFTDQTVTVISRLISDGNGGNS